MRLVVRATFVLAGVWIAGSIGYAIDPTILVQTSRLVAGLFT